MMTMNRLGIDAHVEFDANYDGDVDDDDDGDVDDGDADNVDDSKEQSVFWTRSGSRTTLRFCCKAMKKREILVSLLMSKNNPILFSLMEEILSDGRFLFSFNRTVLLSQNTNPKSI